MASPRPGLNSALVALMSIATGLSVACNYYVQPLLATIAQTFDLSFHQAGFIVTTAQLGYAAGLLLLVPLGDMLERRGLIVIMSLLAAGGMVITALSGSLMMMLLGTVLTGCFLWSRSFWCRWLPVSRTGKTGKSRRHCHERPVAGYPAGAHRCRGAGAVGRMETGLLGSECIDGDDGTGLVARVATL